MKAISNAILYTILGIVTLILGILQLFIIPIVVGASLLLVGIFWIFKAKKGQGNLSGW